MKLRRFHIVILLLALFCSEGFAQVAKPPTAAPAVKPKELSLVRVNVTGQPYDYTRPWQKRAPFSKRALGAVLSKGRVLVTADLVANQNYVELERAETGEKTAAEVVVVDYEANLALVRPTDEKFLNGLAPLQLALDTVVGDHLAALQLEPTGALVVTEGLVTTIQMTRYPADVGQFLTYRISMSMQYRDNSYTIPLVKNNKLAGLLLRYDPRSQVLDAIPAPIIAHFLKEAETENYRGFPSAGFGFFPTRDPQLRKFAGQTGKPGGVYVTSVEPNIAGGESGDAGRRYRDGDREQRDRSERQLRRSAVRQDRVHKSDHRARFRRRYIADSNSARRKTDAAGCRARSSSGERLRRSAL